jgi:hypothetical protein
LVISHSLQSWPRAGMSSVSTAPHLLQVLVTVPLAVQVGSFLVSLKSCGSP